MPESQHIEYKQSWHDEYLKWICGFANADGGILKIGVDDSGKIVGIENARRLLEDIPNKVRDLMGILVEVNLKQDKTLDYLEIVVEAHPYPINHRGKYYIRSGSTLQELRGAALDQFILRKQGRQWDGLPIPGLKIADLSSELLVAYRKLLEQGGRLGDEFLDLDTSELLDKLKLTEGGLLKRAGVLLFHHDPEVLVSGAFVKIGYFHSESDLAYQDELHGGLFKQVSDCLDRLRTKYFRSAVFYDGIQRIEKPPVPEGALREMILNAIVHRDYSIPSPIQIRIFKDRLSIWNPAKLPDGWTGESLVRSHASRPHNPDIANAFHRAGLIEAWGQGIQRILSICSEAGMPDPNFRYENGELWLDVQFSEEYLNRVDEEEAKSKPSSKTTVETTGKRRESVGKASGKILSLCEQSPSITIPEMAAIIGITERSVERNIHKLQKNGFLKRVGGRKEGHWEVLK